MTDNIEGWTEVAEFEDATAGHYEEADYAAREFGDGARAVEVVGEDESRVELPTEHGERWVRVARFNGDDPYYDGERVADSLGGSDDYRVTVVKGGDVVLEKQVSDDD